MEARNLIVCSDGTWNTPLATDRGVHAITNVVKIFKALYHNRQPIQTPDGTVIPAHLVFYDRGVGTGGWRDKHFGGATGDGLEQNVLDGYNFLVDNYRPGDKIFFFGFSRGAYTVRRLAGFICKFGLLKTDDLSDPLEQRRITAEIYDRFLMMKEGERAAPIDTNTMHEPEIEAIGVWDTVGAMGIPRHPLLDLIRPFIKEKNHYFNGRDLSPKVKYGFHALALDEPREIFEPTLWNHNEERENNGTLLQVWFSGAHANIGGGYQEAGLSDIALQWMINRVKPLDLHFRAQYERAIFGDCLGELRNPRSGIISKRLYAYKLRTLPDNPLPFVHESVCDRLVPRTLYGYNPELLQRFRKWSEGAETYPTMRLSRSGFFIYTDPDEEE